LAVADALPIDDLRRPRFTPEVEEILTAMAGMAEGCDLDAATLHRQATDETGLRDFGPRDYEARLDVLLAALRDVGGLTPAGRLSFHGQVLQLLKNRLLLTDLLARHPGIPEIELAPPVIIAGLPRTGTTHLHNLLAADPRFRTLPYWESLEPFPLPTEVGVEPDPRRTRTDAAVWFMNTALPLFPLMHEMTTDHVHEEIALLAIDFSTMFFETIGLVPGWGAYYRAHDQAPHYRFLRLTLQALQHVRPGGRWLLKSPQHLEQLPVLAEVFPDATVVLTHRDPGEVVVSLATMLAYTARLHADPVDAPAIGRYWADRVAAMLAACARDRGSLGPDRSLDVRFADFMADERGTCRRVYDLAGVPLTPGAEAALDAYLASHARGRLGRIAYRPADVGLDLDRVRARCTAYTARFLA
jgi:Sulfotransferase family